jgi:uncharacterized protein (DUF1800 family)
MRSTIFCIAVLGLALCLPAAAQIQVTVSPSRADVSLGTFLQLSAKVTGTSNTGVSWTIALALPTSKGSPGFISNAGRYTPPETIPDPNVVFVIAASNADPTVYGTAALILGNPYPTVASVSPAFAPPGQVTLTVNGSRFVNGAQVTAGESTLPATWVPTTFVSSTKLTISMNLAQSQVGHTIYVRVTNPDPGLETSENWASFTVGSPPTGPAKVTASVASRFLDQAAFGPDAATVAHVQQTGLEGYLDEQFDAPITPYPDPSTISFDVSQVQARFFTNAVHGQDQLRQRVAFALGQIFVVSAVMENSAQQLVPYEQVLQRDAFGNLATLMKDVTLSPTMGEYLSMLNNDKANAARGTKANENYARELMQLFTIGLVMLNPDGSLQYDAQGQPIPTYTQADVAELARVFTGWTYPTKPGAKLQAHNPAYYIGPMEPFEANHDTGSKTLLNGLVLPAGQTAEQDLAAALNNIFKHPNVAPLISMNLIQHLVTGNPSPAYLARISAVFNDNGSGVRGDLKAVVKAILLDPEARAGDSDTVLSGPDKSGHLREPVFFIASALRGLGALVNDSNALTGRAAALNQIIFAPPSVFNYYAPGYVVPADLAGGLFLVGPEFQLQSPATGVGRANLAQAIAFTNLGAGTVIDFTALTNLAADPSALVDAISNTFLHGRMPSEMRTQIMTAVTATTDKPTRARTAVYLTLSSSYYNVEH